MREIDIKFDFSDEAPTTPFVRTIPLDSDCWTVIGEDALSQDEEGVLVAEALTTVSMMEPWYERLARELSEEDA